jgi:hypothetical protein
MPIEVRFCTGFFPVECERKQGRWWSVERRRRRWQQRRGLRLQTKRRPPAASPRGGVDLQAASRYLSTSPAGPGGAGQSPPSEGGSPHKQNLSKKLYRFLFRQVLQYKQRCADLEAQMLDYPKPFDQPSSLKPSSLHLPTSPQGTALEQAQQHLRELREERITDLDTALRRLDEEKRR